MLRSTELEPLGLRPTSLAEGEWRRFAIDEAPSAEPHASIARLIRHYQGLSPGPGLLPGRQHFEPMAIHDLLPHIWLLDVVPNDSRRYRVRLVGGALVEAGTVLRKGLFLHDVTGEAEAGRDVQMFNSICDRRQVDWRRGRSAIRHAKQVAYLERAICPMAADGTTVDLLLCMTLFYWTDGRIY
jgi:hypothetical protein